MSVAPVYRRRSTFLVMLRVGIIIVPVLVFVYLVNLRFVIFMDATYVLRPNRTDSSVAYSKGLLVRSGTTDAFRWLVNGDTLNITARVPRQVPAVRTRMTVAVGNAEFVSLTQVGNGTVGDLITIVKSNTLDKLDWAHRSEGGLTMWQRGKRVTTTSVPAKTQNGQTQKVVTENIVRQYESLDAFRRSPPDMSRVGTAGVDPMAFVTVPGYQPSTTPLRLPSVLRGKQVMYVYAAHEDLRFSFEKIDRNIIAGPDPLTVTVRRADVLPNEPTGRVYFRLVGDDGVADTSGSNGQRRLVDVVIHDVPPAMYRIELETTDDVLIDRFTTWQHVLGFANKLYLVAGPAYRSDLDDISFTPLTVRTNSQRFMLMTNHPEGKQTFTIDSKKIELNAIRVQSEVKTKSPESRFIVTRADLIIDGADGLITLDPFILPGRGTTPISLYPAPNLDGFDYLIVAYNPNSSSIVTYDRTYRLADLKVNQQRAIGFHLNIPGLRTNNYQVGLKTFSVVYERGPFPWKQILEKARSFIGSSGS